MPEVRSAFGDVSGGTSAAVMREVLGEDSSPSGRGEAGPGGRCASVLIRPPDSSSTYATDRPSGQARSSPRVRHSTGWNRPGGNKTTGPGGSAQNVPLPCGKAGEMCERFDTLQLIEGDRVTGTAPTYRGEGRTFL
jgi:hypothetical protein